MKINRIKIAKYIKILAIIIGLPLFILSISNCGGGAGAGGGSAGSTPISLPAPTGGYITVTSPDASGKSLVYGYIYDSNDQPVANTTVNVTNTTAAAQASLAGKSLKADGNTTVNTTTDDSGYFSTSIDASLDDTISVTYIDPDTGEESEAFTTNVTGENQLLSDSSTMLPKDVALDLDDGYAVIVANDGTNSEILEIDMTTGEVHQRATFSEQLFDKIAVHSSFDHAAVLDTTNNTLHWYDLANLANDMDPTSSSGFTYNIHDVAIAELDLTIADTPDLLVVSHDFNELDTGIIDIYEIDADSPYTLGTVTKDNCLSHPDDPEGYPTCSDGSDIPPLRATKLSMIETTLSYAKLVVVAEYLGGSKAIHFAHFRTWAGAAAGTNFYVRDAASAKFPRGGDLSSSVSPVSLEWYDDDLALITDSAGQNLIMLTESNSAADGPSVETSTLEVGMSPKGIAVNSSQDTIYIADNSANSIVDVDASSLNLSGTSQSADLGPTQLVYYPTSDGGVLGVILTDPKPIFKIIDLSQ